MLDKKKAQARIEKLKTIINYHRYLYHVLNKQKISDNALDSLKKELFDLEQQYPEFITKDSPTQRIEGKVLQKFNKIKHFQQMLSLFDAFSEDDIKAWEQQIKKLLTIKENKNINFFCELKNDGIAIEIVYENNILQKGSTRGNGLIGEDITQNLKTVEAIPLRLENNNNFSYSGKIVVQGEIFLNKDEFEKINQERLKKNLPLYSNARNTVAGLMRRLDSQVVAQYNFDFIAYDLIIENNDKNKTHSDKHQVLKQIGFKINPYNKICQNLKEVFEFYKFLEKKRPQLKYNIDGIVVIVNSNKIFKKLGIVGKAPRGAIAYKFPLKQATTIIQDIQFQIGRTGVLTPVAFLKPVQIDGVSITRVSLHNIDKMKKLDIRINDTVIIGRAGDVIPDIIQVLPKLRDSDSKKFIFPKHCPFCSAKIDTSSDKIIKCSNQNCFNRQRQQIIHFASKPAFNIEYLGPAIVSKLLDNYLIKDSADIFFLKKNDLLKLEGFQNKSASNLVSSIKSKKTIAFSRFIFALGIDGVGEKTAQDLSQKFQNLFHLKKCSLENLREIDNIGEKVAQSIYNWFKDSQNKRFLDKLFLQAKIKIIYPDKKTQLQFLKNKKIVLTGILKSMTRNTAKEKIHFLGGQVMSTISSKIDYLVVGENPGSKYKKIGQSKLFNSVKIINEQQFLNLIKYKSRG